MSSGVFREGLLKGRVAVVTGGGSGINLGIAGKMASHGARLVLVGRTQEKLDAAVRSIEAAGGTAMGVAADVRNYAVLEQGLQRARESYGEIDILVCGAAGNFPAPAVGMSANGFKSVIDIDLLGTFNTCRAAFEWLRKPGASVICISATQSFIPTAFQAHVCAAKSGIDILAKTLAIEWGPAGIRVNCITPGPIDETEGMRRLAPSVEIREKLTAALPLRRFGRKDEIADLALFLSSDAASYITGAICVCDGGQSLVGSGIFTQAMGLSG